MPSKLILCSTFRHYFLGISLALTDKRSDYHIAFIDQKTTKETNLILQLAANTPTPFASVSILPPAPSGSQLKKRTYRKHCFSILEELITKTTPNEIITGNDRRVEFQFCMHFSEKQFSRKILGSHIDDGTGSYIHPSLYNKTKVWIDEHLDTAIKRAIYGRWYSYVGQLGYSEWTSKLYLTLPNLITQKTKKTVHELTPRSILSAEGIKLLKEIFNDNTEAPHEKLEVVFALPHSSLYEKLYGSRDKLLSIINGISHQHKNIYIKYHPRDLDDPLNIKDKYEMLRSEFPIEYYLVTRDIQHLISDISTSLLSAKWINPNMNVQYLPTQSEFSIPIQDLFKKVAISPLNH